MNKVCIAGQYVHPIGIGTWAIGSDPSKRDQEIKAIRAGIDQGAQVIDTAEMYDSEELVGEAIKSYDRKKLFLISKVLPSNASKRKLATSLEKSLQLLGTDYLDHYMLHWQGNYSFIETVMALEEQKKRGLIRSWGVSNLDTEELKQVLSLPSGKNCASNQVRYNLKDRGIEYDLLPYMREQSIPLIAYAPVAKGDTLGKKLSEQKVLIEISNQHNCDVYQLLLAWCIRDKRTIAIPKSSKVEHMVNNIKSAEITLSKQECALIDQYFVPPTKKEMLALW